MAFTSLLTCSVMWAHVHSQIMLSARPKFLVQTTLNNLRIELTEASQTDYKQGSESRAPAAEQFL